LTGKKLAQLDVGALFHGVLFAHQKVLKEVLGQTPSFVIATHTIPIFEIVNEKAALALANTEDSDEALNKFAKLLMNSELVKKVSLEKHSHGYSFNANGCAFASHIHDMLEPKDVTCPWGIIAMSIAQKTSNRKVKMSLSEFHPEGANTPIMFL